MSRKLLIFDSPHTYTHTHTHTHTQQLIKQFFPKTSSCSEGPYAEWAVMDSNGSDGLWKASFREPESSGKHVCQLLQKE